MKETTTPPATVLDVARTAGVSVGTVSRVINGHANISADNIRRVMEAIASLGYTRQRNPRSTTAARRAAGPKTGNIGMVFEDGAGNLAGNPNGSPIMSAYVQGAQKACQEAGYHLLVEIFADGRPVPGCIREGKVDGLLIKALWHAPAFMKEVPAGIPQIGVGLTEPLAIPRVAPDNHGDGVMATNYLWSKGHRRIAYFSVEALHPVFLSRYQGYEEFLRRNRLFDPSLVLLRDWLLKADAREEFATYADEAVAQWLALPEPPTAIIAANDSAAKVLYEALGRKGISIPQDISVISFDGIDSLCEMLSPRLTSYAIPFADTAYLATRMLLARIKDPSATPLVGMHLLPGQLVERDSVRTLTPSLSASEIRLYVPTPEISHE